LARGLGVTERYGDGPPPPRPASNVQDNAGLFTRDPDRLRAISERLRTLEQRHGFHLYLVIEPVMIGSSAVELAARLQQAWLPDGDGFVLVFESDNGSFGLGHKYEVADGDKARFRAELPSYYAAQALDRARSRLASDLEPDEMVDQLSRLLVEDVGGYLDRSLVPPSADRTLRLVLATVGVLSALGLAGLGLARLAQRAERRRRRSYYFQEVSGEERLGAPFGALVSARRFSESPNQGKP
jgi:hypothetical protein